MPLEGFHYAYGTDSQLIENKWLEDLEQKYSSSKWLRLNAAVDDIRISHISNEYYSNDIFSPQSVIFIRNVDAKLLQVFEALEDICEHPLEGNAVILIGDSWNKTTKLGKLIKKHFKVTHCEAPEVKPFDLLDAVGQKDSVRALQQTNLLQNNGFVPAGS